MQNSQGKIVYPSFEDANKVAEKMRKTHHESFTAYRTNDGWCVGGNHTRPVKKNNKVNSLQDMKSLFYDYKLDEDDLSVDDYIEEIQLEERNNKISVINGNKFDWILKEVEFKYGRELGMNNDKRYLALTVKNSLDSKLIRMGGAFEKSIDLLYRYALNLKNDAIVWHTWNNPKSPEKWSSDLWFYRIDPKI
jgi:hypothetical protein